MYIKAGVFILLINFTCLSKGLTQHLQEWNQAEKQIDSLSRNVLTNLSNYERSNSVNEIMDLFSRYFNGSQSFQCTFSNTKALSIQYPLDSSFRIITGQHFIDDSTYRYYGGIQLATGKFFPLNDSSQELRHQQRELDNLTDNEWYGALYYRIFDCIFNNEKYYLLLGFNAYSFYDRQKIIDIISFDQDNNPRFGKQVFLSDTGETQDLSLRKIYTFSADVSFKLNYDADLGYIVLDHLMPISSPYNHNQMIYVPNGSLEGFRYSAGLWQHINVLDQIPLENIEVAPILENRKGKDIFGKNKKTQ